MDCGSGKFMKSKEAFALMIVPSAEIETEDLRAYYSLRYQEALQT